MLLRIVYDNEALPGFESGWGFACLIEHEGGKILFDTGWDGGVLLRNLAGFGVAVEDIKTIVISHSHWDHAGGLASVLHPNAEVFVPISFSKRLKNEISDRAILRKVSTPCKVAEGMFTTGELGNDIKEQSLVLETESGNVVLTGCAHPGLDDILEVASQFGRLRGAIGGFHSFSNLGSLAHMELLGPCHCTARKAEIEEMFPDKCLSIRAGQTIEI